MKHILVVCTGNICRSPMAVGLLRDRLEASGHEDVVVESAGIYGLHESPAAPYAQQVMRDRDIDISDHSSRQLTIDMVRRADIILVMEQHHRWFIRSQAKEYKDKVLLMSQLVGEEYDIRDPYQGSRRQYEYIAAELEGIVDAGLSVVLKRVYGDEEPAS